MIKNSSKFLFMLMIIFSSLLVLSASSWMMAWIGLEINLIAFISYLLKNKNSSSIESSIIYFLFQTIASIILLFSLINYMNKSNFWLLLINMMNNFIIMALMMKIGAAPFHFWLPMTMFGLNWNQNYILMTWQKLSPLILMWYSINKLMFMFIFFSAITGMLGGLNQTSLKKLMAYSSINQISWMLMSLIKSKMLWKLFMSFYFFILFTMIYLLMMMNIKFMSQLYNLKFNKLLLMFLFFNILSMGGLPPFLGFFPKMMIIMNMNNNLIILFMIIFSIGSLFFYLRMMYFSMFLNNKLIFNNKKLLINKLLIKLSFISNFLLLILLF